MIVTRRVGGGGEWDPMLFDSSASEPCESPFLEGFDVLSTSNTVTVVTVKISLENK